MSDHSSARTVLSEGAGEGRGARLSRCEKDGSDAFTVPRVVQLAVRGLRVNDDRATLRRHHYVV